MIEHGVVHTALSSMRTSQRTCEVDTKVARVEPAGACGGGGCWIGGDGSAYAAPGGAPGGPSAGWALAVSAATARAIKLTKTRFMRDLESRRTRPLSPRRWRLRNVVDQATGWRRSPIT